MGGLRQEEKYTHEETIPLPAPARVICMSVGDDPAFSSCSFVKNLYEENTKPFIKATVACQLR